MLGTLRSRRAAAIACLLAAAASAGPLTAQTRVAAADAVAATLLSDCDITVQSCGTPGGELYSGGGYGDTAPSGASTAPKCGAGWKVVCETKSAETCVEWVIVEGSGTVRFSATGAGAGGSITQVCAKYVTNTVTFYIYA